MNKCTCYNYVTYHKNSEGNPLPNGKICISLLLLTFVNDISPQIKWDINLLSVFSVIFSFADKSTLSFRQILHGDNRGQREEVGENERQITHCDWFLQNIQCVRWVLSFFFFFFTGHLGLFQVLVQHRGYSIYIVMSIFCLEKLNSKHCCVLFLLQKFECSCACKMNNPFVSSKYNYYCRYNQVKIKK